jgi:hypothetical protein
MRGRGRWNGEDQARFAGCGSFPFSFALSALLLFSATFIASLSNFENRNFIVYLVGLITGVH